MFCTTATELSQRNCNLLSSITVSISFTLVLVLIATATTATATATAASNGVLDSSTRTITNINKDTDIQTTSPESRSLLLGKPAHMFRPHRVDYENQLEKLLEASPSYNVEPILPLPILQGSGAVDSKNIWLNGHESGTYSMSRRVNPKPFGFKTTLGAKFGDLKRNGNGAAAPLFENHKGEAESLPFPLQLNPEPVYECIFSTSRNCGSDHSRETDKAQKTRFQIGSSSGLASSSFPSVVEGWSSIPFRISPGPVDSEGKKQDRFGSPAPAWVKLQPLLAPIYDPFSVTVKKNGAENSGNPTSDGDLQSSSSSTSSRFANRIGEELTPESFANRYGYNADGGGTGGRLPPWLEELNNYGYGGASGVLDQIRGEQNKNTKWVKLDPVSVSGVSISKWVPKGTSNAELPSTNSWPPNKQYQYGIQVQQRPGSGGGGGHNSDGSNSGNWWDRVDLDLYGSTHKRPNKPKPQYGWSAETDSTSGNSFGGPGNRFPTYPHKQRPDSTSNSDAWNDVIYPDGPVSATASWEADKEFGGGSNSHSNRPSTSWNVKKRPIASWASPSSIGGGNSNSYNGGKYGGYNYLNNPNRRHGTNTHSSSPNHGHGYNYLSQLHRPDGRPSNYPDASTSKDDPRWVLVSSTSNIENAFPSNGGGGGGDSHRNKYRPDFPYQYYGNTHRQSKALNQSNIPRPAETSYVFTPLTQDQLFHRTNTTLHSLKPALDHSDIYRNDRTIVTTTKPKRDVSAFDLEVGTGLEESSAEDADLELEPVRLATTALDNAVGDGRATASSHGQPANASRSGPAPSRLIGTPAGQLQEANLQSVQASDVGAPPKKGFLQGLNPIYTAVGAGMIPATLAAVLPIALGRRKRRRRAARSTTTTMTAGRKSAVFLSADPTQVLIPIPVQLPVDIPSVDTAAKATAIIKSRYKRKHRNQKKTT